MGGITVEGNRESFEKFSPISTFKCRNLNTINDKHRRDGYLSQWLMFLNILGIESWSRLSRNELNVQSIEFGNGQESSRARIALITSIRRVSNKSRG